MIIRKAEPTDAAFAAPLIYEAIGDIANMLTGAQEADEAIRMMGEFFAQKNNRLSYENALIAMDEGVPVGLALFYHGSQTEAMDQPFVDHVQRLTGKAPRIVKEAKDDEFYLDTVVVSDACRGKGIGKKLLEAFEKEGERRGHERVALLVDEENGRARQLYESIGYRQDGTIMLNGHLFSHMVKELTVLV